MPANSKTVGAMSMQVVKAVKRTLRYQHEF